VIVAICFVVFMTLGDTSLNYYYAAMLNHAVQKKIVLIMKGVTGDVKDGEPGRLDGKVSTGHSSRFTLQSSMATFQPDSSLLRTC